MRGYEIEERLEELVDIIPRRHLLVLDNIVSGMTQGEAYISVYRKVKKQKTANDNASRMLANDSYQEYIDLRGRQACQSAADRLGISVELTLEELANIAFGNLQDLFDENGNLMQISELPRRLAASVRSVKVRRVASPAGHEDMETHVIVVSNSRLQSTGTFAALFPSGEFHLPVMYTGGYTAWDFSQAPPAHRQSSAA